MRSLGSSGGFCAGSKPVVDHQRLSGSSYCFSAAMPAMLAISSIKALDLLSMEGEERLGRLRANIKSFRKHFNSYPFVVLDGDELHSPIIHFRFPPQWNNVQQEEEILDTIVEAVRALSVVFVAILFSSILFRYSLLSPYSL